MPDPINEGDVTADVEATEKTLQEGFELWKSGCDLWLQYLQELPSVRTPAALMEANSRFLARSLEISGLATGALLRDAGLRTPTLNEN